MSLNCRCVAVVMSIAVVIVPRCPSPLLPPRYRLSFHRHCCCAVYCRSHRHIATFHCSCCPCIVIAPSIAVITIALLLRLPLPSPLHRPLPSLPLHCRCAIHCQRRRAVHCRHTFHQLRGDLLANYLTGHYELCDIRLGKITKCDIIKRNILRVKQVKQTNIASDINQL